MSGFPRHQTSGMTPALPAMKTPMVAPVEPAEPSMPVMKPPKVKGATVSVKKPKPPSSQMRIKNGM